MLVKNLVRFRISVPMSYPSALRAFPPPRSRLRLLWREVEPKLTEFSPMIYPKRARARKHCVGAAFCIKRSQNEAEMRAKAIKMEPKTS